MLRIISIEFHKHPFFRNQKFDFTIQNDKSANTVIIAGENGNGKTKLIEFIFKALSASYSQHAIFLTSQQIIATIIVRPQENGVYNQEGKLIGVDYVKLEVVDSLSEGRATFIKDDNEVTIDTPYLRQITPLYSSVNINYSPRDTIGGVTTRKLDDEMSLGYVPNNDIAYDSIQLLVDINTQDNDDLARWVDAHENEVPPNTEKHIRIKRFTEAFSSIFQDKIKFKGIENNTKPIFSKNGTNIEITELSSGEKQIVFRGIQLLKNRGILEDMPVFIDEPELSMHPKWENLILNYYRSICSKNNIQSSQLFIVTHSEHILSSALNDEESCIIKMPENNEYPPEKFYWSGPGQILPTVTIGEIKYSIFGMYTIDFHISLYGALQSLTGKTSIDGENGIDGWLKSRGAPLKSSQYASHHYETLPTLIRNHIDHPDNEYNYSEKEFIQSTEFLIEQVKQVRSGRR